MKLMTDEMVGDEVERLKAEAEMSFAAFRPSERHLTLLQVYVANGRMGLPGLCGLILADVKALLDLGARQRALEALQVLRLLASAFPEFGSAAIPKWTWAHPSTSPSDRNGEALRELEFSRRTTDSGNVYAFRHLKPCFPSAASPFAKAETEKPCASTIEEEPK